ncbi:MAG: demethoxyubiquinone hydroxylase family protein [Ferrovibrio sp.]|uniref:demethoxyubiquinone hydroxylase family protein n=1 Tax=Ferrovibrio sp. TaxID=1917215 RepID=UPI00391B74AC
MPSPSHAKKARLAGDPDPRQLLERILRVDHAGEYGAKRIYEGQLAVLKTAPSTPTIRHMAKQEQEHLDAFSRLLPQRRVRPTLLSPLWHVGGFAMGAATALMGEKAAMACTEAVEEVIDAHYTRQIEALGESEPELRGLIEKFRADEIEHRDTARAEGAQEAPGYDFLSKGIKAITRGAIWLSERV